jgi:DtxR family Mn-dependent transcriptional regulator
MEEGYHTPLEEYLQTILSLNSEGTEVIGARIAERLGRSAPAVKEMLDRLEEDGYIERRGRAIVLTEQGQSVAVTVARRHGLAERLLVDVIGLEWHKVHEEAGKWEHVISSDVEAKLIALLGDPSTCPHGNPIPGSARQTAQTEALISSANPGDRVLLVRIAEMLEFDDAALEALDSVGFIPGCHGVISERGPDGSLTVTTDRGSTTLRGDVVDWLFIAA